MVLEVLAAGAVLGKAFAELVEAVKDAANKISSFKPILKSIESRLETITPRLEEITRLDEQLNHSSTAINDLVALVLNGKVLVDKCSKVDRFNFLKVRKYHKLLVDFESHLSRYFSTVIQLDHSKDAREALLLLKEIKNSVQALVVETEDEAEGSTSRERRDDQAYCDKPVMTREERARGALRTKTAENKKEIVLNYVDSLKKQFGNGVSTKFIVYNATGDSVEHVGDHDWFGNIGPAHYPSQIANGQWGGFLHVKTVGPPSGSVGAVVYRGKNLKDEDCDWMLSWSNPWLRLFQQDNCVYTEIREAGHYEQNHWGYINGKLESSGKTHKDNWNGCSSSITSGTGTTVVVEVIMTLKDALIDY